MDTTIRTRTGTEIEIRTEPETETEIGTMTDTWGRNTDIEKLRHGERDRARYRDRFKDKHGTGTTDQIDQAGQTDQ